MKKETRITVIIHTDWILKTFVKAQIWPKYLVKI